MWTWTHHHDGIAGGPTSGDARRADRPTGRDALIGTQYDFRTGGEPGPCDAGGGGGGAGICAPDRGRTAWRQLLAADVGPTRFRGRGSGRDVGTADPRYVSEPRSVQSSYACAARADSGGESSG